MYCFLKFVKIKKTMDKVISSTLKVISVLFCIWLIYILRDIIFYFLFAFVIAFGLRPLIDKLEKQKIPRGVSCTFIFLLFLVLIFTVVVLIVPPFINEVQNFLRNFNPYSIQFSNFLKNIENFFPGVDIKGKISQSFSNIFDGLFGYFSSVPKLASGFFGGIFNFIFVLIISFYFAIEKELPRKFSKMLFSQDKEREKKFLSTWQRTEKIIGRWLYSYVILATIVGLLVYIGLTFLGVKYSLLLAVLAGVFEIVPLFGPIFAGIIGTILAFLQGGVVLGFWAILLFILVQQIENFLIIPYVMKTRVDLHPILVIVVLFVAGKIFGTLGAIISIPIVATIIALVKEDYKEFFIERTGRLLSFKK